MDFSYAATCPRKDNSTLVDQTMACCVQISASNLINFTSVFTEYIPCAKSKVLISWHRIIFPRRGFRLMTILINHVDSLIPRAASRKWCSEKAPCPDRLIVDNWGGHSSLNAYQCRFGLGAFFEQSSNHNTYRCALWRLPG